MHLYTCDLPPREFRAKGKDAARLTLLLTSTFFFECMVFILWHHAINYGKIFLQGFDVLFFSILRNVSFFFLKFCK